MSWIRDFSASENFPPPVRNVDADAPLAMRHELVDLIFHIVEQNPGVHGTPERIYRVICQSLGEMGPGNPWGGFRRGASRVVENAEWQRVYDLISRLWSEFKDVSLRGEYRKGVNKILSAYGVVWDLDADGHLRRTLPPAAQNQVNIAIAELGVPRFAPALQLLTAARDAYDDRPRRDRDACSNVFDAMESVAKEVLGMPTATFGQAVAHLCQTQMLNEHIVGVLQGVNTLRNRIFGHGMTQQFNLSPSEVDFTYLTCIGGILLFVKLP